MYMEVCCKYVMYVFAITCMYLVQRSEQCMV